MARRSLHLSEQSVTLFDYEPELEALPVVPAANPLRNAIKANGWQRRCTKCKQFKPCEEFPRDPRRRDGFCSQCMVCRMEWNRQKYAACAETRQKSRQRHLLRAYGLTSAQVDEMRASQGGQCAICRNALGKGREAHVDHCHATGKVRAILCLPCNQGVGLVERSPHLLNEYRAYLERHR